MVEVVLQGPDDVNSALIWLRQGVSVQAVAGEDHRRPKSWLLHELVEESTGVGALVHHPRWVTRGIVRRSCHMKSCVLQPEPNSPGDPAGVREPRRPRPPTDAMSCSAEVPRDERSDS